VYEVGEAPERRIPADRRVRVLRFLRSRGAASVAEIAKATGVSESTVRRDLKLLDSEKAIRRSHGGAVAVEHATFEPIFEDRRRSRAEEKEKIGRYAATLLEEGQGVVFDSSSTVIAAIEALTRRPLPITAVTNDVYAASLLAVMPKVKVVVSGGEVRAGSFTLLGPETQTFFEHLHADTALVGIHSISGTMLTEAGIQVAAVKRAIIRAAKRVILLVDHSKFGPPAFFDVCGLDAVDDLVTDSALPEGALETLSQIRGMEVHLV
jgi:DeoR family transcriptional regulator of aga operon